MSYLNNIVNNFLNKGKEVESRFARDLVQKMGGDVMVSTKYDDIKKHIDLYWRPKDMNKWCSFDVKGQKKTNRSDTNYSTTNTWLEIKNVNGGIGSLLGEEHYLAFEVTDRWLIARRKVLLEKLKENIIDKTIYNINPNADFKMYQRKERKDLIIRVPLTFIENFSSLIIPKNIDI